MKKILLVTVLGASAFSAIAAGEVSKAAIDALVSQMEEAAPEIAKEAVQEGKDAARSVAIKAAVRTAYATIMADAKANKKLIFGSLLLSAISYVAYKFRFEIKKTLSQYL